MVTRSIRRVCLGEECVRGTHARACAPFNRYPPPISRKIVQTPAVSPTLLTLPSVRNANHKIEYYGGYENVARRLHLGYNYEDELLYQERVRDDLQLQNEKYGKVRERNLEQQRNKLAKLRVRLQTKRAEHEREIKLAAGLRRRGS